MKTFFRTFFLSLLLGIEPIVIIAQEQAEELNFKSGGWTYNYYVGDLLVSYPVFTEKLMEHSEELASMFHSGRNLSITGTAIGSIGAFCFGYDLGTRLAGGKGNATLLAGGGVVMGAGIIMYYVGEGKMKKALTLYKNKNNNASLTINPNSLGLGISFNF